MPEFQQDDITKLKRAKDNLQLFTIEYIMDKFETGIPGSQTGMEGISCFTCSVNSSGLETKITLFIKQ